MKIFVTGVNGLIGSYISEYLLSQGHTLVALKRKTTQIQHLSFKDQVEWADGDVTDVLSVEKAIQGVDLVVHNAAIVSFNKKHKGALMKTNVEGTANVVNAALAAGVSQMIHLSSVAALGKPKDAQVAIAENSPWLDSAEVSAYAESKYLSELEVWRGHEEGLKVCILNPSVVLGVSDWKLSSTQLFHYAYQQRPFYPQGVLNYVDVRDIVSVIDGVMRQGIASQKYVLNGGQVSYHQFFTEVAAQFGKKGPSILIKGGMLKVLAALENLRSTLLGTDPLITKETARMADKTFTYDTSRVQNELNLGFRSLSDSIQWVSEGLKNRYSLK
ncbi:SDR family NAD(P)-dependent oxidoreductase [Cytophagales bacterium LB-30]|uniref:SDR family NAD(P)-dependent oxidoreductase n=1 Tax=Shiella aurantiaca TaxID=3058365 RepID=A0ABT8F949_9BACT|nr:SDR family NAD(P)-dependent oxidoreductase [Shiella aurantiaca]MDN4166818.1 SDR family NAD(P)-dependent oxidoreductase [Shiella aurantiaca]